MAGVLVSLGQRSAERQGCHWRGGHQQHAVPVQGERRRLPGHRVRLHAHPQHLCGEQEIQKQCSAMSRSYTNYIISVSGQS